MTGRRIHRRSRRAGFTLVEMLVVLAILAIATTIAVQSLVPVASEARYEATAATLSSVSRSVISVNKSAVSGFLVDTGRLPVYSSSVSTSPYSVDELTGFYPASATYGPPADLGTYQAVSMAMTMYTSSTATASTTLTVNSGWNGPYLLAPSGSYTATSATSIVDGWGQALPAFLYPDTSHGNGMSIWSTGDPTTGQPVSTTLVPSALAASTVVLNGTNSVGVPASPTWGSSSAYYYAVYGPAPLSLFGGAPSTIGAAAGGPPYEVAVGTPTSTNPAPAVYRYIANYSPSYTLTSPTGGTTVYIPGPTVPGLGPRAFCILDSLGNIVSGPIYQVILPGSNTVNFLVH